MNEYKSQIDDMVWSYSRLATFENCKYEFYLNYIVDNDEEYLSECNFYAEVGSFVHQILAMIFNGELTPEEATQYYIDNYEDNVLYRTRQSIMDKTFEACANYFSDVEFNWLNNYDILGVELETKVNVGGYHFIGFIDLLLRDKNDGKIVVVDHKSSEYPFKRNGEIKNKLSDKFESYKKQMYLYSHAVKEQFGEFPKELRWNHFKDKGRIATIPFNQTLSFFYCTQICNFRNSCEYCKSEDWRD